MKNRYLHIIVPVIVIAFSVFAAVIFLHHRNSLKADISSESAAQQDQQIMQFQQQYEQKLDGQTKTNVPAQAKEKLWTGARINFKPGGIPVLMYHYIGDLPINADGVRKDLTVSSQNFNAQMDYLSNAGYHTISTAQLSAYLSGNYTLSAKPIVITFDDGHEDAFQNAIPILLSHHMIGSFAIVSGFLSTADYTNWQEIKKAQSEGMEIINHSYNHMDFNDPRFTSQYKEDAVMRCENDLYAQINDVTKIFVYPYGHYNMILENILKKDGFSIAFTTNFGEVYKSDNPYELPRIRVHGLESLERFREMLGDYSGLADISAVNSTSTMR